MSGMLSAGWPPLFVCFKFSHTMFAAGLDSPGVYRNVGGGGPDIRQLADTGEELLHLLYWWCDMMLKQPAGPHELLVFQEVTFPNLRCLWFQTWSSWICRPCVTGWFGSCRICLVPSSPPRCRLTWFVQFKVRFKLCVIARVQSRLARVPICLRCCFLSVRRDPGPGGLRPGAAGCGQLADLSGPVRPDPAQCGPTSGPSLSAWLQKPAEAPKPSRELQPAAVPALYRVSNTQTHTVTWVSNDSYQVGSSSSSSALVTKLHFPHLPVVLLIIM